MTEITAKLSTALADRYKIERHLGEGGMATVYLAEDLKHERKVAVKVLRPELAAVVGAERFLQEIQIAAKLNHPHILTLIDSGEEDGFLYYVMPHVQGESLRDKLTRERQLSIEEAVAITQDVASALGYAHAQGVIHRDIKPGNILMHEGEAIVADFGIALALQAAAGHRLTETGLSLGTPQYMSPEQATADHQLDARSDIYSMGAVLYEMLAGEPPHTGRNTQAIIAKLLTERPTPLRTLRDTVPERVEQAVTKALGKVPADRFESADEFAQALEAASAGEIHTGAVSRGVKLLLGGGMVLGVALLLGALGLVLRRAAEVTPVERQALTFTGTARYPALSPDGDMIAYIADRGELVVQDLPRGQPLGIVSASYIWDPRWTPDGKSVLFRAELDSTDWAGGLYSVPRLGGPVRRVGDRPVAFAIHPNGDTVVASHYRSDFDAWYLRLIDVRRGDILDTVSLGQVLSIFALAWSPDGDWIAFVGDSSGITLVGVMTSRGVIADSWRDSPGWDVRWSPTGDGLYYFRSGLSHLEDLIKIRIDARTGKRVGDPTVVMTGVPTGAQGLFDLSGDGTRMAYAAASGSSHIWAIAATGDGTGDVTTRQATTGTAQNRSPSISPDGQSIAFSRSDHLGDNIYIVPFDGGEARPVTATLERSIAPIWSPDGRVLVFWSRDTAGDRLILTDPAGRRHESLVTRPVGWWEWFPDGDRLLLVLRDPVREQDTLAILDLQGNVQPRVVLPDSIGSYVGSTISPDGRYVALVTSGRLLYRLNLDDLSFVFLFAEFPRSPVIPLLWSDDGYIYVAAWSTFDEPTVWIWRIPASGGAATTYLKLPLDCSVYGISMSRDAKRFACLVTERDYDIWLLEHFDPTVR